MFLLLVYDHEAELNEENIWQRTCDSAATYGENQQLLNGTVNDCQTTVGITATPAQTYRDLLR